MKVISYTLRGNRENARQYYEDISDFADMVVQEGYQITTPWIYSYKQFIIQQNLELVRSDEEYMLEMLTLGVLWLCYSDDAAVLNKVSKDILIVLSEMRQKGGVLKIGADFVRGVLGTVFLYGEHKPSEIAKVNLSLENYMKLIHWLAATGEFKEEVKRLEQWHQYLQLETRGKARDWIAASVSFALWFECESLDALGQYTRGVKQYLERVKITHRWREDLIFCSRQQIEYHLNMVGAEIMNRAFRTDFVRTKRKIVLLPICIRRGIYGACKASRSKDILHCIGCDPVCQVNQIKGFGDKYGFEVLMIPHESSTFSDERLNQGEVGIVGIACATNLMAGGWKAKNLGIPAQCVLLDYCGCRKHWDEEGFPTAIDMEQLCKILDISKRDIVEA